MSALHTLLDDCQSEDILEYIRCRWDCLQSQLPRSENSLNNLTLSIFCSVNTVPATLYAFVADLLKFIRQNLFYIYHEMNALMDRVIGVSY